MESDMESDIPGVTERRKLQRPKMGGSDDRILWVVWECIERL